MISTGFQIWGIQHLIVLALIAGLSITLVWVDRKLSAGGQKWLGRSLGLLLAFYGVFFYIQQGMADALSWEYSLPLDLCSVVLIACILALFRTSPFFEEISYFWGIGGTLQALITPDLGAGFPSCDFFLFFWSHGAILLGIVFIITARNFRPRQGCVLRMMIALNTYAVVVGAINVIAGWNYGYLCWKPAVPSLLDLLGPWPWYLLSLEGIALLTFFVLALPWKKNMKPGA